MSASIPVDPSMKRFRQILLLLLLALMLPASVCCEWSKMFFGKDCVTCGCQKEGHQGEDHPSLPGTCPSDTLSSSELPAPVTVLKVQMALLADLHPEIPRPEESRATQSACDGLLTTTAPPEVRTTWCFVSRTALPVRAPSVLA